MFLLFQSLVTVSEVLQGDLTLSRHILRALSCESALYLPPLAKGLTADFAPYHLLIF